MKRTMIMMVMLAMLGLRVQAQDSATVADAPKNTLDVTARTMAFTSETLRLVMQMLAADSAVHDSLEKVIEQRAAEFERAMQAYEAQMEAYEAQMEQMQARYDAAGDSINARGANTPQKEIRVITLPFSRVRADLKAEDLEKKRKTVKLQFPGSVGFGRGIPMYKGDFTYNGAHAALFPISSRTSVSGFEWLTLYLITRSGHWGASLSLMTRSYAYDLVKNIHLDPGLDQVNYRFSDTAYEKVSLSGNYWGVPLMIHWMGGRQGLRMRSRGMYVGLGGEVLFLTRTRVRYYSPDYEVIDRRDFPLHPVRINALLRIGYGNFYGEGSYTFTPIYRDDVGVPSFNLLTLGLGFRF